MGCPIIYRAQGEIFPDKSGVGGSWLGVHFPYFVRFINPKILCTTLYEAQNMVTAGIPAALVSTIHLGVRKEKPAVFRSLDREKPIFGIFGRLVRWKGQDTFVRAMGELARQGLDFEAWIVGSSSFGDGNEYEQELHQLITNEGVAGRIRFLGFRRDVPELMEQCDVICHCSDFEPFGLVIIEAMMAGKPVVASDVSGPRESIRSGESGFLLAPRDPISFAQQIRMLIDDPLLRERIGRSARVRAETSFDLEHNLNLIDEECCQLIAAKARKTP
jgi:glycosyltransferase involved in cell wall biosynthesis